MNDPCNPPRKVGIEFGGFSQLRLMIVRLKFALMVNDVSLIRKLMEHLEPAVTVYRKNTKVYKAPPKVVSFRRMVIEIHLFFDF